MTAEQARTLGQQVLAQGLDAHILPIGRGDEYCVRILSPQWHCFTPADFALFRATVKKPRKHKAGEQEAQRAIDSREAYHLAIPSLA